MKFQRIAKAQFLCIFADVISSAFNSALHTQNMVGKILLELFVDMELVPGLFTYGIQKFIKNADDGSIGRFGLLN